MAGQSESLGMGFCIFAIGVALAIIAFLFVLIRSMPIERDETPMMRWFIGWTHRIWPVRKCEACEAEQAKPRHPGNPAGQCLSCQGRYPAIFASERD